jgi:hypothetical protein
MARILYNNYVAISYKLQVHYLHVDQILEVEVDCLLRRFGSERSTEPPGAVLRVFSIVLDPDSISAGP